MLKNVYLKLWRSSSTSLGHQTKRFERERQMWTGSQTLPKSALRHLSILVMKPSDLRNTTTQ
ncbi:hypothetical protein M404DRAFT_713512 [Pisolithus tinctorius Marx 270]|uniref:Uncharacterized protein n=1 Tax=Pisolithus tinctorius Marx 270 TaxID=870435 RepID=A0A0C3IZA1_PISTI|nr:hypothetical protein M404DRAFT_713512 [Pisolithus tinctorius Marx 270]